MPRINRLMGSWRPVGGPLRGILTIGSSSAAGQLVALLAVPVLSRLYTPEDLGVYASVLAIATILIIVGPLRLDSALQIASERDIPAILCAAIFTSLCSGLLCLYIAQLHLGGSWTVSLSLGLIIVALVFTAALYNVLSSLVLRSQAYGAIAKRNFARAVGTSGGQIGAAPFLPNWTGLLIGAAVGQLLGLGFLARQTKSLVGEHWRLAWRWSRLRRYWRFPMLFAPSALLNAVGVQIPLLFISASFGAADAGNLAQALRVGAAPALVVGVAFSSVIMAEVSKGVRAGERDQRGRFMKASKGLLVLGVLWLVALAVALPPVLPPLLGDGWEDAGRYTQAIAISAAASVVVAPLSVVLIVYERAVIALVLDVLRISLTLTAGAMGIFFDLGPIATCFSIAVASALVYGATWVVCLRTVTLTQREVVLE